MIKIFLASSIKEFENERMSFTIYLTKLNKIFEEQYHTSIIPFICETADSSYSREDTKQDEYNKEMAQSDMVIFLIGKRLGQYTREEFEFACKTFKDKNRPRIYVYFCELKNSNEDVLKFRKILETEYHHYYDTFDYIDTIKLSTLFNLQRLFFPLIKIEVKEDFFYIDGQRIEKDVLSPSNIQAFYTNNKIQELLKNYDDATDREKHAILKRIDKIRNDILNVYSSASKYSFDGLFDIRSIEAMRLLEKGDLTGFIAALDTAHAEDRIAALEAMAKRNIQNQVIIEINRFKSEIAIRKVNASTDKDYNMINNLFVKFMNYAIKYSVSYDVLLEYSSWLGSINKVNESLSIALKLQDILAKCSLDDLNEVDFSEMKFAQLETLLGVLYGKQSKFKEAYESYKKAFVHWEEYVDSIPIIQLWSLAEFVEEVACFIKTIPETISDIVNPHYSQSIPIGQLAIDIRKMKNKIEKNKWIDFHPLETDPIYSSGLQSTLNFVKAVFSEEEKNRIIPESISFSFDNPIFEAYILFLFAFCIKQSIWIKTQNFEFYSKGFAMTILNISTIQNLIRDYKAAEDGARLAIDILNHLSKLNENADINEDMAHAYSVLYTSALKRNKIQFAQDARVKMIEYGEKNYQNHPQEFALAYAELLFVLGKDCLYSSEFLESIKAFDKVIGLYERLNINKDIDRLLYLIPHFLSHLKWIEASTYNSFKDNNPNYDGMIYHFNQAIYLLEEITDCNLIDELQKTSCYLELNWCNLRYLLPSKMDECLSIMSQTLKICIVLSREDIFNAYSQWSKTFDILTNICQFILFSNENEEERKSWLDAYFSIFKESNKFIIKNVTLNPMTLLPPHFRRLTDYAFMTSSNNLKFIDNYKTILSKLFETLSIIPNDSNGSKQQLLENIKNCYETILKQDKNHCLEMVLKRELGIINGI